MKSFFYQLYDGENDSLLQQSNLNVFKKAIGIHPLKQSELFYFVHLSELKNKALFLKNKIYNLKNQHRKTFDNGTQNLKFLDSNSVYDLDTEHIKSGIKQDLKNLIDSLNEEMKNEIFKYDAGFIKSSLINGYFDIDPNENFHIIFNNQIKYMKNKTISSNSIQNLIIQVPFLDFVIQSETINRNVMINFILALCNRLETFKIFFKNFYENILKSSDNVRLIIVVCKPDFKNMKNIISELNLKNLENDLVFLELEQNFTKGLYLNKGSKIVSDNEIIFFVDVDYLFYSDILNRIRLNTRLNSQVYMPICFTIFSPRSLWQDNSNLIDLKNGEWRYYGFGAISIFKKDFSGTNFNESIAGWGKEDVEVAEKIMNIKNINVFRANDNSIIHLFHFKYCDNKLPNDQYIMCLKSKIRAYGMKNLKLNF